MKEYQPFKKYNLAHLNSFRVTYIQPQKDDKQEKTYHCLIEFSSHCFTKSTSTNRKEKPELIDYSLLYKDKKETRVFCLERYELSFNLPTIFKNEIFKKKCFFTSASDKFLSIEFISDEGKILNYEIYFSLKKSNAKGCDIHIFVNSAYVRTEENNQIRRKSISFFVLLHNTITNKKINKPK